jgi:hypothetical protein
MENANLAEVGTHVACDTIFRCTRADKRTEAFLLS